jgi:hypothetical protein
MLLITEDSLSDDQHAQSVPQTITTPSAQVQSRTGSHRLLSGDYSVF